MNSKIKKVLKYIVNSDYRFLLDSYKGKYDNVSDEEYLKRTFKGLMGKTLNLDNPITYNEKLQWLKLYDRNNLYTKLVDKCEVKEYVAAKIGEEYVIPTLGVWDTFDEIDFDSLPNEFVLKCTHDSGGLVICKDKNNFDIVQAKLKIENSLNHNYFYFGREWPYKNVRPRIIAEKYLEDLQTGELRDYKFLSFNGEPQIMFIATERQKVGKTTRFDYYDMQFNHLELEWVYPNADITPKCPICFEEMKRIVKLLSNNIPHVRVDLYEVNGKVYFGEFTFFHQSGMAKIKPESWDKKLGDLITLPII